MEDTKICYENAKALVNVFKNNTSNKLNLNPLIDSFNCLVRAFKYVIRGGSDDFTSANKSISTFYDVIRSGDVDGITNALYIAAAARYIKEAANIILKTQYLPTKKIDILNQINEAANGIYINVYISLDANIFTKVNTLGDELQLIKDDYTAWMNTPAA